MRRMRGAYIAVPSALLQTALTEGLHLPGQLIGHLHDTLNLSEEAQIHHRLRGSQVTTRAFQ